MKQHNANTNTIENMNANTMVKIDGANMYFGKLTTEQRNSAGYYDVEYKSMPNRKYYTAEKIGTLVDNVYVVDYIKTDKPMDSVKGKMLKDLKDTFTKKSERPKVDTGLGYYVDGSYKDLENFKTGLEFGLLLIKDCDGVNHNATADDYSTIIQAIKAKGIELYHTKWTKEAEINSLATIEDCILYEATPYEYTITQEDVDRFTDMEAGEPPILGDIITKYKNNVTNW